MTLRVHPDEIVRDSDSALLAIHPTWARVRLSDVADVLNGFAFKSTHFSTSKGVPLLRIRDVACSGTATNYVGEFDSAYLVEPGSIVVGMDGDFRAARWAGPAALLNQRVCKISVRDERLYDAVFLFYALPGYLDAINARTSSVTVKHLSSRTIQDIPLPLPPLAEQWRIVAVIEEQFSRLDNSDELLLSARRRLRALRSGVLSQIVEAPWPHVRIGDVADVGSGATPKRGNDAYWLDGTIPWVTSGQLTKPFVREPAAFITETALGETNVKLWPKHTLLVALYGEGKTRGHCSELLIEATTNQACAAIVLNDDAVARSYLKLFFGASYDANRRLASGGVQPNLSLGLIKNLRFPLPPLDEQHQIVANVEQQLSIIDAMARSIEAAASRSAALRRSILEQAFSGKLVPQDPSDEPARALLERITAEQAAKVSGRRTVPSRRRETLRAK